MTNAFMVRAQVYRWLAEEELSVDTTAHRLRSTYRDQLTGVKGTQITEMVQAIADEIAAATSALSREFVRLMYVEIQLRGELQEAIQATEPTDPAHCRQLIRLFAKLSRDHGDGFNPPDELLAAVEIVGNPELKTRLAQLYPEMPLASEG